MTDNLPDTTIQPVVVADEQSEEARSKELTEMSEEDLVAHVRSL
jgi:hypothetical protein